MNALALAWLVAAGADVLAVHVDRFDCVVRDRYTAVSARLEPADAVASAEAQFRAGDGGWYGVTMARDGERWRAMLPRPTASLAALEYRVVATSATLETTVESESTRATVEAADACATPSAPSVASSIVVRVPPGAPLVPPVPAGFSPAGAVTAQETLARRGRSRRSTVLVAGALAVAGGALAVVGTPAPPPTGEPDIPGFAFTQTFPPAGSTLSVSNDSLRVVVTMDHEPVRPFDFSWRIALRGPTPTSPVCVFMMGDFDGAQRPVGLLLTNRLLLTGACPGTVDLVSANLVISVGLEVVWDVTFDLSFHLVP